MSLEDLYQEIILDHYRAPKNRAPSLEEEDVHVHHSNPLCGDEMDLRLRVADGRVDGLVFDGEGCSISQASASAMTQAVTGRELKDALDLAEDFRLMMHGDEPARADDLLDGVAFQGVSKFPVRVKCALLGWMAVRDAIETYQRGASESAVTYDD
ncbi:MAG: SUF system NifU family Fe-S cluster assembly protein [Nitriliruptor sp.]|uniref:Fe-S cluster assembly sulfur transfer protein SufU n=1 Tax=Nitriliruptor sp. TaxID=2448056 RepID=UPI0034A03737